MPGPCVVLETKSAAGYIPCSPCECFLVETIVVHVCQEHLRLVDTLFGFLGCRASTCVVRLSGSLAPLLVSSYIHCMLYSVHFVIVQPPSRTTMCLITTFLFCHIINNSLNIICHILNNYISKGCYRTKYC